MAGAETTAGVLEKHGEQPPLRFPNLRTFDQLFMLVGAPNLSRSAFEIARHACDIKLRLLRPETGHSQREFWRASPAGVGRRLPLGAGAAMQPFAEMRSLSIVCFARILGTAAPGQLRKFPVTFHYDE
jgi:hypothetical protein